MSVAQETAMSEKARIAMALLVAAAFFMENLDATAIAPAVPEMAKTFGVLPVDMSIGMSAYMLALGIFIPISGWIAERYGAKKVFASAIALFTLASLLCTMVQSLEQFVCVRILQGTAGAMMVPVGRLVVLKFTPKEQFIHAIAILTWPGLVAPVLGPPIGGLFVDHADWRWIFYLNIPLGVIAFFLTWKLFPRESDNVKSATTAFDWRGFILLGCAIFSVLWTSELLAQTSVSEIKIAFYGAVALIASVLFIWHLRRTASPVLRFSALKIPTFFVALSGGTLFRISISAVPFLLPLMYQIGFGMNATQAGFMLIAVFLGNLAMKPFTTRIIKSYGFKKVLLINGLLNSILIGAYSLFTPDTALVLMCLVLFASGMTRSMQFTAINTIAFADVDKKDMNAANTLFSTAFQISMGIGIALGAIALRIGSAVASEGSRPDMAFRIAFIVVAIVSFVSLLDIIKLDKQAGHRIT